MVRANGIALKQSFVCFLAFCSIAHLWLFRNEAFCYEDSNTFAPIVIQSRIIAYFTDFAGRI